MKQSIKILTLFLFSQIIFSQEKENKKLKYGFALGLNISNLIGSDAQNANSKIGFQVGAIIEPKIRDNFAIETGMYYTQLGAKFESLVGGKYVYNYLHFPILAKYYFNPKIALALGPNIGFNISKKIEYDKTVNSIRSITDDNVQNLDIGIKAKLQYIIISNLFISAEYYHGLTKVYKDNYTFNLDGTITSSTSPKIYNTYLNFSVGYIF